MTEQRVPSIPFAEWGPEALEAFAAFGDSPAATSSNIVTMMAQHPALAKSYFAFGGHILARSTLPDRIRELVTLRVVRRFKGGDYEWHHHVRFALAVGIGDDEIEAVKRPLAETGFAGADRAALGAADALCETHELSDAGWDALAAHFSRQQIMDLVFTIGLYVLASMTKGAFRVPLEDGVRSEAHPPR